MIEADVKEALKRLPRDVRIVLLHLEKKIEEIASMSVHISEQEKQGVLSRVAVVDSRLDYMQKSVEQSLDHLRTELKRVDVKVDVKIDAVEKVVLGALMKAVVNLPAKVPPLKISSLDAKLPLRFRDTLGQDSLTRAVVASWPDEMIDEQVFEGLPRLLAAVRGDLAQHVANAEDANGVLLMFLQLVAGGSLEDIKMKAIIHNPELMVIDNVPLHDKTNLLALKDSQITDIFKTAMNVRHAKEAVAS